MKLTEAQLKQIIQEEINTLEEGWWDRIKATAGGAKDVAGIVPSALKGAWSGLTGKALPARKGGTFTRGKTARLVVSHTQKIMKFLNEVLLKLEELHEDFDNDIDKTGMYKHGDLGDILLEASNSMEELYADKVPSVLHSLKELTDILLQDISQADLGE